MDHQVSERRAWSRFLQPTISHVHCVLRPGRVAFLVNLSAGGALLESRRPFRPGARVFLNLWSDGHSAWRVAHVLRCSVASLQGTDGVRYRGALRFEQEWVRMWEEFTHEGYGVPDGFDPQSLIDGQALPAGDIEPAPGEEGVGGWRRD